MQIQNRLAIAKILFIVPLVSIGLKLFGLKRTWYLLNKLVLLVKPSKNPQRDVQLTLNNLKSALTHTPWQGKCLSRSLVLWWQLARQGIDSQLRIGVHKRSGFHAHAWIEYQGLPLDEGKEVYQRYQIIEQFSLKNKGI